MQSPREVVRRAVEFQSPDRIPMRFDACGVNDTHAVNYEQLNVPPKPAGTEWRNWIDEWGCGWVRSEVENMGRVAGHPLADWERLDRHTFPDPYAEARWATLEDQLAGAGEKYVIIGNGFTLWERAFYLHGYESMLADFYLAPDRVHELLDRILNFHLGVCRVIGQRFHGRVHGMGMTDDWGTQQSSTISIPLWRTFFKERYEKLYHAIHKAGMHAWMHSCGRVNDVVGEWIDVGLDVVNLQQPTLLGIEEMGRRYRGRVCFETVVDIQKTLPFGTRGEIEAEAALLLREWGTPEGGFILSDYGDGIAIGVPDERKWWMFEAFKQDDPWTQS
jgi:uroporphyrinogen decarboxylase